VRTYIFSGFDWYAMAVLNTSIVGCCVDKARERSSMKVTEQVEGKAEASKQFELCVIPDVAGPNPSRAV